MSLVAPPGALPATVTTTPALANYDAASRHRAFAANGAAMMDAYRDAARDWLAAAVTLDEVMHIHRQAQQMEIDAAETRIRAERRLGELLKALESRP